MAVKYGKKKHKQNNIIYTLITAVLLSVVFIFMISSLYKSAEEDAYENLHVQTKQIKDDILLQMLSDRENLVTMASFASKLYLDGGDYSLMFDSFKPIGLIENIGILKPDNTFVTKAGTVDLDGKISFDEEKQRGEYISGRMADLTRENYEIIRSAVPIKANGEVVGVLYGVIKLDKIGARYSKMASELDAQLFVYDAEKGDLVVDSIHRELGNISFLADRVYNDHYTYEDLATLDNGFVSFKSAYRNENLYLHYSTIDELGWKISLARYDSQVFSGVHELVKFLMLIFLAMAIIVAIFAIVLDRSEKRINSVTACAAEIRRTLLEMSGEDSNISRALETVTLFVESRSAVFFDTDGENYNYISPGNADKVLFEEDRRYFMSELIKYASEFHRLNGKTVNYFLIKPNKHLAKTNPELYRFFKEKKITNVPFSAAINSSNYITILAMVNAKRSKSALMLAQEVSACFSIALFNKNHLHRTTLAAITDSLTGAYNRVAYKNDLAVISTENARNFSCIYVDVNELHLRNNKYGHAAGDEMLLYIANTLKEVFYGHKVYRMGGDEFLVFCKNVEQESIKKSLETFKESLKPRGYHVAVGISFRAQNVNTEEMVREAELRMYEEKALYYQNKEQGSVKGTNEYVHAKTGILEIDTMISVLKENYNGIYRVSLDTDKARRILMPAYLNYSENEENFSSLFSKYVSESVDSSFHRGLLSFLNYDAIRHQLSQGSVPKIRYRKNSGEMVVLSVYKLCETDECVSDTLWVFAKD